MKNSSNIKDLIISSALYASSSILGPLLIFGGAGMFIDSMYGTKPWGVLIGVFIAFIVTNVLLFKKIVALSAMMEAQAPRQDKAEDADNE